MVKTALPRRVLAGLAVTSLALTGCGVKTTSGGGGSDGESYPTGAVEMPVGASAGGSSDLISRSVADGLSEALGGNFVVINQEGANGALAAQTVANAEPDGSTISVQNASLFAITPLAVSEDEVTELDDFEVVGGLSRDDYVLVTSAESGFESIDDLKADGSRITYATTGVGTGSQLATALTFSTAEIPGASVPFDGGSPALTALLGDQVDVAALQLGEARENIESGDLVPLAVYSPERVEYLPDVPTASEQGYDVEVYQYRFLTVPAGTPQDVQDTLAEGLQETFGSEQYQQLLEQNALTPMEISGEELTEQLESDTERYASLVEEYDIDLSESNNG